MSTGSSWGYRVPQRHTPAAHRAAGPLRPDQRLQPSLRSRPSFPWPRWESGKHIFDLHRRRSSPVPDSFHRNRCNWTLAAFGTNRGVDGTSSCLKSAGRLRGWPRLCEFSEAARAKRIGSMKRARSSCAGQGGSSPAMAILPSCYRGKEHRFATIRTTAACFDKSSATPSPMLWLQSPIAAYFLLNWACRWISDAFVGIIARSAPGCAVAGAPGSPFVGFVSLPIALG